MTLNPLFMASTAINPSEPIENMSDKISYGLETVLLGMGVVFSVLIIIMIVLSLFKVFFYKKPSANEQKAEKPAAAPAAPVAEPEPGAEALAAEADDAELVAVITAAIASMLDAPQTSFRVVSFRRTARK